MRKFTRRTVFQTLVSLTLAVSLAACGGAGNTVSSTAPADSTSTDSTSAAAPAADAVVLRVNMSESADSNKSLAMEEVKAEIEKNTEGRVTVEIHNNGELGTFQDDIEAISGGANIVSGTSPSAYSDYGSKDLTGLDLMMALRSYDECDKLNQSDLFKELCKPLESTSNLKILGVNWGNMPRCILSNKSINSVADLKGKIIRVPLAPYVSFFTRLGCTTQSMTLADTYTALQQGTIDACEFGYDTLYNNSMYEVAKYCYVSEHTYAPSMWCMSAKLFDSLSAEDQQVVLDAFYNGGNYAFNQGDVFMHCGNDTHCFLNIAPEPQLTMLVFQFEQRLIWAQGGEWFEPTYLQLFSRGSAVGHYIPGDTEEAQNICSLLQRSFDECVVRRPAYQMMVKSMLLAMLSNLVRFFYHKLPDVTEAPNSRHIEQIERSMQFILKNLDVQFTLDDLAREAQMSRSYYSTIFRELNGMSVWDYITNRRIERAQFLLETTDAAILDISGSCGYNNISNFNRAFRQVTGKTPRQFRNDNHREATNS